MMNVPSGEGGHTRESQAVAGVPGTKTAAVIGSGG
jgi:hypothetical protein